jgi:P27 family predicted phage terminase small subunit
MKSIERIKEDKIKACMISLDIYQEEFDETISMLAGLQVQYEILVQQLRTSDYAVLERTGYSSAKKKNPMITVMETLRKDILAYSNALGLTPSGLKKIKANMPEETKKVSSLELALSDFGL